MKLKRWIALLLALAMAFALTACGEGASNFTAEKLNVWIWDKDQQELWQGIADEWSARTRIEVKITVKDKESYWADVDRGVLPDIFCLDTDHAQSYMNSGILLRLNDQLDKHRSVKLSDYNEQVAQYFAADEYVYGIPKDCTVSALWYNTAIFDALGVGYPDDTWTWDTFADRAIQLTNRHNGAFGVAQLPEDGPEGWYSMVYSYGGSFLTADENGEPASGWKSEGTMRAMNLMAALVRDAMPAYPTMKTLGSESLFMDGHTAMTFQNSSDVTALLAQGGSAKWACTVLPYCDLDGDGACGDGERAAVLNGTGWVISAKTGDPDAAFDLLMKFISKEANEAQAKTGSALPAFKGTESLWMAEQEQVDLSAYQTMLNTGKLMSLPVQTAGLTWLDHAMNDTLYTAWNNPSQMSAMLTEQDRYMSTELRHMPTPAAEEPEEDEAAESGEETPEEEVPADEEGE